MLKEGRRKRQLCSRAEADQLSKSTAKWNHLPVEGNTPSAQTGGTSSGNTDGRSASAEVPGVAVS